MKHDEIVAELRQIVDNMAKVKYLKRTIHRGVRDASIVRGSLVIDYVSLVTPNVQNVG